jgi:hypothetical protein
MFELLAPGSQLLPAIERFKLTGLNLGRRASTDRDAAGPDPAARTRSITAIHQFAARLVGPGSSAEIRPDGSWRRLPGEGRGRKILAAGKAGG